MKRSEALIGIFDILYKTDNNFQYSTAYEILNYLENKGMLPPAYKIADIYAPNTKLETMTYYVDGLAEWEPEE